jgi:nucleotide-binding universal stress UspA family protein
MFEKILLPLDGSAFAERSIPHAIEFARIFNSDIILLHVLEPKTNLNKKHWDKPLHWQLLKTKAEVYLHEKANKIRQSLSIEPLDNELEADGRVRIAILEGKAAENIVDFAQKKDIDLLIISSHGAGGLSRWSLNNVISKVINQIYKSILIIRSYKTDSLETAHPRYQRILIPIDCSPRSECAINTGIIFAKNNQSKLLIISVVKFPEIPNIEYYYQDLKSLGEKFQSLKKKAVRFYLDDLTQRISVNNETRIIENENITKAILNQARVENTDLIIVCAHGHSGDPAYSYGAIARSCIDYFTKSVLIIQDLTQSQAEPTRAAQLAERTRSRD